MNITKISKLVLAIFLLLSVKCICKEGSLTNMQIIALIKDEVKKIQIPDYVKPIEEHIIDIKTKGLEVKLVKTTSSNLEKDLIKSGLSNTETSIMKGIIFASKTSYKSFNFEAKQSSDNYGLLTLSQFVGFSQRKNDSIEVAFVNIVVTGRLCREFFPEGLGHPIIFLGPLSEDEIYNGINCLKEYAKNEFLEINQIKILS